METCDIVVVGAGASGLMAAGRAAELGADVLLVDHMPRPGVKLGITGKGRCNITNTSELNEFLAHFHPNGRFLRTAFSRFFSNDLVTFLEELGVETVEERGGRVFPGSSRAADVVDALINWNRQKGVRMAWNTSVESLLVEESAVRGVRVCPAFRRKGRIRRKRSESYAIEAKSVVLATGGMSYPATGSTGDGYALAESVGHSIVDPRPGLVPLETDPPPDGQLNNLTLKNCAVTCWVEGKKKESAFGELTFMPFGLSGPVILTMSHLVVVEIDQKNPVRITVDLKPALDHKKLDARLLRDLEQKGKKQLPSILKSLLPAAMIPFCLSSLSLAAEKRGNDVTADERKKLRLWLKHLEFNISGYRPFSEAIITCGGVSLKEVDPNTMASKKVCGLFLVGEMLDIQADTGGYNLQAAFSTGKLAAESIFSNAVKEKRE